MAAESISRRSLLGLAWVGVAAAGRVVSQLLVQIVLARLLGPDAFGQFALIMTIIGLCCMLADLGLGAAMVQKAELSEADISLTLGFTTLSALGWAVLLVMSAPTWSELIGAPELGPMALLAACVVVLLAWRNIAWNLLRRDLRIRDSQLVDLAGYLFVFGGVSVVLAMQGFGAWSLLIGLACNALYSLVATYALCRHTLRARLSGDPKLLRFGLTTLGNDLMVWVSGSLDRVIVGRNWGMEALGCFAVASNLVRSPTALALESLQGLIFASGSRLQDDAAALRRGFSLAASASMVATLPAMVLLALEAERVVEFVYGKAWLAAAPAVAALAISVPCLSAAALATSILRAKGAVSGEFGIQAACAALLVAGLVALADWPLAQAVWWITGVAALRAALLVGKVLSRLQMRVADLIRDCRGALLLAACVGLTTLLVRFTESIATGASSWAPLLSGSGLAVLLLWVRPRTFLGSGLTQFLHLRLSSRPSWSWLAGRLA